VIEDSIPSVNIFQGYFQEFLFIKITPAVGGNKFAGF